MQYNTPQNEGSAGFRLAWNDLRKIGLGALIAAVGAALTYLEEQIPGADFGAWTPVAVSLNAVLVNAARKLLTNTQRTYLGPVAVLCFCLSLMGCAGSEKLKMKIDGAEYVSFRHIGSGNQGPGAGPFLDADGIPIQGIPMDILAQGQGVYRGRNVEIKNIKGGVTFEWAVSDNQNSLNVDVSDAIDKLYGHQPEPFSDAYADGP